jgi:glycosyltransferase involved in cell wall biosynthesis
VLDVSVVIGTWNRAAMLGRTLEALFAQQTPATLAWEIIVVDNNSTDTTRDVVESFARRAPVDLRYVFEPRQGLCHARNRGVAESRATIVAFTDDDIIQAPDWVAAVPASMSRWEADGVGGRMLPLWEAPVPRWLEDNDRLRNHLVLIEFPKPQPLTVPVRGMPIIVGGNMAFRRELFDELGPFDGALDRVGNKLYLYGEIEFITRALGRGHRIVYDPSLTVFHRVGPDRVRKAYFRKRTFDSEEGRARTAAPPPGVRLLGAPRWIYVLIAAELGRWLTHLILRRPDAFLCELDLLARLGQLSGYRKQRPAPAGAGRPPSEVSRRA